MTENRKQEIALVNKRLQELGDQVYQEMYAEWKKEYLPAEEVHIPDKAEFDQTLKSLMPAGYMAGFRGCRPNVFYCALRDNNRTKAMAIIRKTQYLKATYVSKSLDAYTARLIKSFLVDDMFIESDVVNMAAIPIVLAEEMKKLYTPFPVLTLRENQIGVREFYRGNWARAYHSYLFVCKILVLNSKSKAEYEENIAMLHIKKDIQIILLLSCSWKI